jgi:glycosyltransferase involved in cell wall biosynthesis
MHLIKGEINNLSDLVSCIITSFNSENFIAEAVNSILEQTYKNIEIIVADGGSTDNTEKIIEKFNFKIKFLTQKNTGPAATRNFGLRNAQGTYIAFLDADDLWHPEKLERQMNYLAGNPDLDLCITNAQMFWSQDLKKEKDFFKDHPRTKPIPGYATTTLLAKKSVFRITGEFNDNFWFSDAIDWFIRARELGLKIKVIEEPLTFHRMHNSNLTKRRSDESRDEFLRLVKGVLDRKKK